MRLGDQSGFSLIELTVVSGIIGVLAAIAIPQYAGFKSQGVDAQMECALRNGLTAMQSYSIENGSYDGADATVLAQPQYGYRPTADVQLKVESAVGQSFVLRTCATGGGGSYPSYVYDSSVSKIVGDEGSCS